MTGDVALVEPWVQTYTGHAFPILSPRPADIILEDVAHALANTCRPHEAERRFLHMARGLLP